MRTTGSDDLYRLIHSLTTEEKGYFKKFAKRHSSKGNNYLALFDAINKQKEFEEATLKKKFKDYKVWKVYLRDMIADALILYLNNKSNETIYLSLSLAKANMYERKGLPKLALAEIHKGLELAQLTEEPFWQHRFTSASRHLEVLTLTPQDKYHYEVKHYNRLSEIINKQQSNDRYIFERAKLFCFIMKNLRQAPVDISEEDIDLAFVENPDNALTYIAKRLRFEYLAEYYHHKLQADKEYEIAMQSIAYAKEQAKQTPSKAPAYVRALEHAARACISVKKYDQAEELLNTMVNYKTHNQRFNKTIISSYVRFMLFLFTQARFFDKGKAFVDAAAVQYPEAFKNTKDNVQYDSNMACAVLIRFMNHDYHGIFKLINEVDNGLILFRSPVYLRDFEIMRLMIQVELKNFELLPAMVSSVKKKLIKNSMCGVYEKHILSFFANAHKGNLRQLAAKTITLLDGVERSRFSGNLTDKFLGTLPYTDWFKTIK